MVAVHILEEYEAESSAYEGKSFNYYDPADDSWHQVWVDNGGIRLHLTGGYADGRMVMSGTRGTGDGTVLDRITWHNDAGGTVRQVVENVRRRRRDLGNLFLWLVRTRLSAPIPS